MDRLDDHWSLDGLTHLVYGVPKVQRGLDPSAKVKDPELSRAQRAFFVLVYRLLVSKDTGPRLPTLLLAVGAACGALIAAGSGQIVEGGHCSAAK